MLYSKMRHSLTRKYVCNCFYAYDRFDTLQQINLVRKVSTKQPFHVSSGTGDMHVALVDCGVKENILRSLVGRGRIMKKL